MKKEHFEKEKNFISVVVYMKNAKDSIVEFLKTLDEVYYENFQEYEFILVDDDSSDNSVIRVKELGGHINGNLSVVRLAWGHGLDRALIAGVDIAIGDFIYEFDSTIINYDVSLIMNVYKESMKGYDVVATTDIKSKKVSSTFFYKILKSLSYRKMELTTETFRLISRRAINRIAKDKSKVKYRKATNHYSGFDTKVIEYSSINNVRIRNNFTTRERFDMGWDVLLSHSNIGVRLAGMISRLFLLFTVATIIYTVSTYLTMDNIQPGWTTTMFFLSISFSGVFFVLSIIAKYLTNILIEVQNQPLYVFKSLDKISNK